MPVLQANNLNDLILSTLKDLGELKFTAIISDLQKHVAMRELIKKNRIVLDSGTAIQWQLMIGTSNAAKWTGMYAQDNVDVREVMTQASMPWRHSTTNYGVDQREIDMNREPRRIVELIKVRRIDAMTAMAELLENAFWGVPGPMDDRTPHGVPYWIVKNNVEGFFGGAPTGFTDVGGVSPTTYTRWRNWTSQYAAVTKADLVRKLRQAYTKTNFTPPTEGIPTYSTGRKYGMYTNYEVISKLEEILEGQNDDLGNDVASQDGLVHFRKIPVEYVPRLDADTTNPIYGIDWGNFKTYVLRGWWLKETRIGNVANQHTVSTVHIDNTLNWVCKDRRSNFVLATDVGLPA